LKVRQREQGADHDPNEADLYKRGKFVILVNVPQLTNLIELLEREREYQQKKQNKGDSAFVSNSDAFKMPKKREIKAMDKKLEDFKLRGMWFVYFHLSLIYYKTLLLHNRALFMTNFTRIAKEYEEELNDKGTPFPQDADYQSSESDASSDSNSDSDASEDDEDEAALLREYAKIKKEREEQERLKEEQKAKEREEKEKEELLQDNPLYNQNDEEDEGVYSLKRKWYDETVFKNQSRVEKKEKKRFINDTVRSDFHRNFLNKFIH
jgi:flagellar biosynthesis GTPase FlhF